ncbi:MAG: TetR family transcriptional regulator [Actinomycetota bacterium]
MNAEPLRRSGRRPGNSGARADILAAARRGFAERGYARATIRGVAQEAGVDPALVHHYFGTKRQLFVEAMALPANPADLIEGLVSEGDSGDLGERMIRTMLAVWDDEERRAPVIALYRSAMSDDQAATMIREFASIEILGRIVKVANSDRQDLRMNLLATQVFGLISLRYIIKLEPLASADPEVVVATVGPTFQRYLTGPL